MNMRRFGPLFALTLLGLCVLIARLYDVQVREQRALLRLDGPKRRGRKQPARRKAATVSSDVRNVARSNAAAFGFPPSAAAASS